MRLDPALVDLPPQHLHRTIACGGRQTRRSHFELIGRAVDHPFGRPTSAWRTGVVASIYSRKDLSLSDCIKAARKL
jgi:hypothetical protein